MLSYNIIISEECSCHTISLEGDNASYCRDTRLVLLLVLEYPSIRNFPFPVTISTSGHRLHAIFGFCEEANGQLAVALKWLQPACQAKPRSVTMFDLTSTPTILNCTTAVVLSMYPTYEVD